MADNVTMQPKNLAPFNGGYDKNKQPFAMPNNGGAANFTNLKNSVTDGDVSRAYKAFGFVLPQRSGGKFKSFVGGK